MNNAENRMGKTNNLFKKIGDIKGTFHPRMDVIRDRNGKYLTEAEETKQRWLCWWKCN